MGVHRKKLEKIILKKYEFLKKREAIHNKKFIHLKKPSQRTGGYRIGFCTMFTHMKKAGGY